ncbi:MAG: hypothetical protein BM555_02860 [Crocinitomix sp. MedPE-SWsnd]|jgi:hypothetical protein|nr:MAG: hypothetical protein BM555_02860 [Crocinitomix sp. MedPE-SWsnd]
MKKYLSLAILLLSLNGFSQSSEDTVRYEMLSDKPIYSWWGAGLSYDISVNPYNFTLAAFGVDATFMSEKFRANIYSRLHLAEALTDFSMNGHPSVESVYEAEKSRDFAIDGSYFITENTKTERQEVRLKGGNRSKTVMIIPAKVSYRYGADLGFSSGVSYYNFGDATLDGIDEDGAQASLQSATENDAISSYFSQHVLRIGASRTKTARFKVDTDLFGKKSVQDYTRLYVHGLVGFGQKLDDVLVPFPNTVGLDLFTRYDISTNANFFPVGAAIGYEYYVMKKMGVSWIAELGVKPGPKYSTGNNAYLDIKLRFHLGQFL